MNYKKWMENLPAKLTCIPLSEIAIPGTHDSFSYSINSSSKISPDVDQTLKIFLRIFRLLARKVMARWALTQDFDTTKQLESGIRYFDIRLAPDKNRNNQIYVCHSFFANLISDELLQISIYLKENDKEVIFLDFNHFYNFEKVNHELMLTLLKEIFGPLLVPFGGYIPTLAELWANGQRVFVFYHDTTISDRYLWPGDLIPSPWANTANIDCLLDFLDDNYDSHTSGTFYVTQGILTPNTCTILTHICSTLYSALAKKLAPRLLSWLSDKSAGVNKINVVIADFSCNYKFVSDVVNLNYKVTVNNNCDN